MSNEPINSTLLEFTVTTADGARHIVAWAIEYRQVATDVLIEANLVRPHPDPDVHREIRDHELTPAVEQAIVAFNAAARAADASPTQNAAMFRQILTTQANQADVEGAALD